MCPLAPAGPGNAPERPWLPWGLVQHPHRRDDDIPLFLELRKSLGVA